MDQVSLKDIKISKLKKIPTIGGDVLTAMNSIDKGYNNFGEAYFSWIKFNSIKAWKFHKEMTLNLIVPFGKVRFVFFIPKQKNKFKIIEIGENISKYKRITVPPKICFGFKGLAKNKSLILNIANIKHSSDESIKYELDYCNYQW